MSLLHAPSRESRASSGSSISWVSPLREDGASQCPGDPGCSESRVSLLYEPNKVHRASAYEHLTYSKAQVTLFIAPTGE